MVITKEGGGWKSCIALVTGADHRERGQPCQDAVDVTSDEAYLVLAVADGHGSAPRSDLGAKIAVECTLDILSKLVRDFKPEIAADQKYWEQNAKFITRRIVGKWRERIRSTYEHQLQQSEEEKPETAVVIQRPQQTEEDQGEGKASQGDVDYRLYGSTLLAVVTTREYIMYFQVGDGDILEIFKDGEVQHAVSHDERLFANETTSLALQSAEFDFRFSRRVRRRDRFPKLILVATDGYANSFDDFLQVGRDYLEIVDTKGLDYVASHLEEWLEEVTERGSGDDIAVGLLYYCPD